MVSIPLGMKDWKQVATISIEPFPVSFGKGFSALLFDEPA